MASGVRAQERGNEDGQSQPQLPWCLYRGDPEGRAARTDSLGLVPLGARERGDRLAGSKRWEEAVKVPWVTRHSGLGLEPRAMQCCFLLRRSPELTEQDVSFPAPPSP